MQTIVPPRVLELSERNQLGAFVRYHRERTLLSIASKMINVVVFIFTFILAFMEICRDAVFTGGHSLINPFFAFPIYFCLYFLLLFGSQFLQACWQRGRNQQVYEFAWGMIIAKRRKELFLVRWENILTLTYTYAGNASPCFRIVASGNEQYKLFCDTIIPRIEQELIKRVLPDKLARYMAGETLKFDTIAVNKEGILNLRTKRKPRNQPIKVVSWNEFYFQMQERHYVISLTKRADGKSYRFSLYDISNACILRELLIATTSPAMSLLYQQSLATLPQHIRD